MINVFGTVYRLHPLFILLLLAAALTGYVFELLTLFAIVLIHELGHVAAAKSFGWSVREVQLLPFGGVAEVEDTGQIPAREEWIVAIAGPLQNGWMIAFAIVMKLLGFGSAQWWDYFMQANLMIALFNLVPVLPLDGGKLLHAFLSYVMSYHRAMLVCSWMSLVMSVLVIIGALLPLYGGGIQVNLLVIGFFLFYSNWYGHRHIPFRFLRFLMGRQRRAEEHIRSGALAQPIIAHRSNQISAIMRMFMREKYHLIYIMNEKGSIQTVLPEQRLIDSYFAEKKTGRAVSDIIM